MRKRVRVQPYISPDVRRSLAAYAAAQDVTESAVMEAALVEYFERGRTDDGPVVRRLDALTQLVAQLQGDLEVVGNALGQFVRYSFLASPTHPDPEAGGRAEAIYGEFLAAISRDLGRGASLTAAVRRAQSLAPAPAGAGVRGQ